MLGGVVKLEGDTSAVQAALAAGRAMAEMMHARCVSDLIPAPDLEAMRAIVSPAEYNPLIEQDVVHIPKPEEPSVSEQAPYAIGMIETQGFTAVIEAIDAACKARSEEHTSELQSPVH